MSEIKAIPTRYKGYHFRSRLEARWAVFFDTLGLEWEYEPEGFEWEGKRYLPDFLLRFERTTGESDFCYAEVKPDEGQVDWKKEFGLSYELSKKTNSKVLCLIGVPKSRFYPFFWGAMDGLRDSLCMPEHYLCFVERSNRHFPFRILPTSMHGKDHIVFKSSLVQEICAGRAINAARSARFEHGQCGAT